MRETMIEICHRRVRATPSMLTIYEHEVRKLAEELASMTREGMTNAAKIEDDIRSGFARFLGRPVRLS